MFDSIVQSLIALRNEGTGGLVVMTGIFMLGAMIFAPRPILCAISGWIFGFSSVVPILVGWTLGSVIAFLLARHLLRGLFQRRIDASRLLRRLNRVIEAEGFKIVFLLRIASPIPGTLLSYLCGVTRISAKSFGVASLLGIVPQVLLFVFIGTSSFDVANGQALNSYNVTLLVLGVAIMLFVTQFVRVKIRNQID